MYRIYRACTSWELFHSSLEKAKQVLERNQYPPNFYDPIIKDTINKIIEEQQSQHQKKDNSNIEDNNQTRKIPLPIQYRGKCTEEYASALHRTNAPCTIVMTLRKLKTTLPSLKPPVEKMMRSGVVYKITCPRCEASYVGQTSRHHTRFREHSRNTCLMNSTSTDPGCIVH